MQVNSSVKWENNLAMLDCMMDWQANSSDQLANTMVKLVNMMVMLGYTKGLMANNVEKPMMDSSVDLLEDNEEKMDYKMGFEEHYKMVKRYMMGQQLPVKKLEWKGKLKKSYK